MMVRFSPPCEFGPAAARSPVASITTRVVAGPFQNNSKRALSRASISARSSLESFDLAQAALDVLALIVCAFFGCLFAGAVVLSVFILLLVSIGG